MQAWDAAVMAVSPQHRDTSPAELAADAADAADATADAPGAGLASHHWGVTGLLRGRSETEDDLLDVPGFDGSNPPPDGFFS